MIDSYHHIELNGVKYRLAEDGAGDHYVESFEPLRPPNAVTVQGESQQKFQMRPDILLWSLTDWSGGEGQIKFDPQAPNRWRELTAVRVFDKPGTLQPGYAVEITQDASGDFASGGNPYFVQQSGTLYVFKTTVVHQWSSLAEEWDSGTTLASTSQHSGAARQTDADEENSYYIDQGNEEVWKNDLSVNTATSLTSGVVGTGAGVLTLIELGDYVYVYNQANGEVWEVPKAGGGETLIDDFSDAPGRQLGQSSMATVGGKVYILLAYTNKAIVREITPTSAAGPGFGAEIARIPGLRANTMWANNGIIYVSGWVSSQSGSFGEQLSAVMYIQPGGSYGSLGHLRQLSDANGGVATGHNAGKLLSHYLVQRGIGTDGHILWEFDALSGGMAQLARWDVGNDAFIPEDVIVHGDDIFMSFDGLGENIVRAMKDTYEGTNAEAISPWHDFAVAGEKVLQSLVLSCEPIPTTAGTWTIFVDYATDGDDTWTNAGQFSTQGGTGTTFTVSTDSSTVTFSTISIRIRMTYSGPDPDEAPRVLGIDVRARAVTHLKRWRLRLDLADSQEQSVNTKGTTKIANLRSIGENVVAFKDGYNNREPGQFTEHDVFLEGYQLQVDRAGEGFATVDLIEVT